MYHWLSNQHHSAFSWVSSLLTTSFSSFSYFRRTTSSLLSATLMISVRIFADLSSSLSVFLSSDGFHILSTKLFCSAKLTRRRFPVSNLRISFGRFFFILLLYSRLSRKISAFDLFLASRFRVIMKPIKKKCSIKKSKAMKVVSFYFKGLLKLVTVGFTTSSFFWASFYF